MTFPRKQIRTLSFALLATTATGGMTGCAPAAEEAPLVDVTCEGKCDFDGKIQSLLGDASKIDLNDFLSVAAKELWRAASKELNLRLGGVSFGSVQIKAPKAYALHADAQQDLTLGDVDQLVTGLVAKYGERELTTQINLVRRGELNAHPGAVFAETSFWLESGINTGFTIGTRGFDEARTTLGFTAGKKNELRLVKRVDRERDAYFREPLQTLMASRGFIEPTSVEDIEQLEPGEVYARAGEGSIGLNLGADVPLVVTSPTPGVGYGLIFKAALRTIIKSDRMDVQVARLDRDEVVVDVGATSLRDKIKWSLAIADGWGVLGVPTGNHLVGKAVVELGRLATEALGKTIGAREELFSASLAGSSGKSRVSVVRLRFNLADLDDNGKEAFAQALHGDVRMAQAMAAKGLPGVRADFDLFRSGVSAASRAGVDLLGMSFFTETAETDGQLILDGPGAARALLFNTLHRAGGWFFDSYSLNRVAMGGLTFDSNGQARAEANLFVQQVKGDKFMERDELVDSLDALLLEVGGRGALTAIEEKGNQIQRYVQGKCQGLSAFSSCMKNVFNDPEVAGPRAAALEALAVANQEIADATTRALSAKLGALRLAASAAHEYPAQFVGPGGSVLLDYRLDEGAIGTVLGAGGLANLKESILSYLELTNIDRGSTARLADQRLRVRTEKQAKVQELIDALAPAAAEYQRLLGVENAQIAAIVGKLGARALEVRFKTNSRDEVDYSSAVAHSLAEGRKNVVKALYNVAREKAAGLGPQVDQVVAHGLLGAVPAVRRDLRVDVQFKLEGEDDGTAGHYVTAGYRNLDGVAKGALSAPINGGFFNIDQLVKEE